MALQKKIVARLQDAPLSHRERLMIGSLWQRSATGGLGVVRGGSWFSKPGDLRSSLRYGYDPGTRGNGIGFRLAQDIP